MPHAVYYAMTHGWYCWAEFHFYYANHALGGWREWLCSARP